MASDSNRFQPFLRSGDRTFFLFLSFFLRDLTSTGKLSSLDALAVACKGNIIITSPNMDYVPEPFIFEEEDLCCRADGRFGVVDCFQWPQMHERQYEYSACIPRKDSIPTLRTAWYHPTLDDFTVPAGSRFAVGTLPATKVTDFEVALQTLRSRHHTLRDRPIGQDALRVLMRLADHEVRRLHHHPLLFRDLVVFVAQLQRKLLDIHALLDYIEFVHPLLKTPPSRPPHANDNWMGCFTKSTEVCEALYFAGVPVWLVCSEAYISPTMNVVHSVRLSYPDEIVRAMYTENGVAKPFPSIWCGPSNVLRHYHTRSSYEGTLADAPEPLPVAHPSLSRSSSSSGKKPSRKLSRTARERASAGPSRGVWPSHFSSHVFDHSLVLPSAAGQSKWEEPNLPDRIMSGVVDPGYRFPKPTLFVNVSTPEKKKTYLLNWLSARPLWISQVDIRPPSKFPSPQMWRDFLNTIDTDPLPSTKTASTKLAVRDILGEAIINSAQGLTGAPQEITWRGMQGSITSVLAHPPLSFMRSLLWELYELNFRYELYALDRALVPDCWTTSNEERITRQTLLYGILPGESGLVMWSESLPRYSRELGLCATDVPNSLPYISKFCQLMSVWPGAPARLQSPVELKGQDDTEVYSVFSLACHFYVQTAFDFLGQQPSLPRIFQFV
ncbi:hypothetical protein EDD17DRAFT_1484013 [Pisolithus thermaeus]|nr:hypothetical protein EDD17DRAFT_1484013 [Pisolithus thermaeus]